MPSFMAETYLPRPRAASVRERERRVREAARELTHRGMPITFVRSIFVPQDEICFLVFDAVTADAVGAACARAAVRFERVVEAVESLPQASSTVSRESKGEQNGS